MNSKQLIIVFLLSFLIISIKSQCQVQIKGRVVDNQTSSPIAYVHIYNNDLGIGTTTNLNGEFNLKIIDTLSHVKLIFSHTSYEVYTIDIERACNIDTSFFLTPRSIFLEEISIRPPNAFDLIKMCVQQRNVNHSIEGFTTTGFQREIIKNQNEYVQLLETDYETKYSNGQFSSSLIDGRFAENKAFRMRDQLWNDKNGGFYVFGITSLGASNIPFETSVLGIDLKNIDDLPKYYNLHYKGVIELASGAAFCIQFYPKEGIKKPLIEGTLYVDSDTYALVELDYKIGIGNKKYLKTNKSWDGNELSTSPFSKKVKILEQSHKIKYQLFNGKWYFSSKVQNVKFTAAVKLPFKTIAKSSVLDLHLEQIISNINSESQNIISDTIPTTMYYYQVYLKNNHENYEPTQWNQYKKIKDNIDYSQVVKKLNNENLKTKTP